MPKKKKTGKQHNVSDNNFPQVDRLKLLNIFFGISHNNPRTDLNLHFMDIRRIKVNPFYDRFKKIS